MLKSCPETFSLDNFSMGLDWASPPDRISPYSVYDAKNINLTSYRALEKRSGMVKHYATPYVTGEMILDIYEYVGPSTTKVLVATNTASEANSKIGYYDTGWHDIKTGLTANTRYYFATHNEFCFVTNGVDNNFKLRETSVYNVGIQPPAAAPTVAQGASTGLSGKYIYVYCYKRSTTIGPEHRSDPSDPSDDIVVSGASVDVTYVASSDPQVDYIEIYRTLDLSQSEESTQYFLVTTVANANGTFTDTVQDDFLSVLCLDTNAPPPKSKFCKLHKDRMIWANCPDEVDGESLFMFSELGRPEACPGTNYQYFDRKDGQDITGIASLPDYLVIFKRDKMAAMEGDFAKWYTISATVGCIAPWAIVTFQDQIMFLSSEGWKVTNGRTVQDVSKRLLALNRSSYIAYGEASKYSAVYYPTRKQVHFLINFSSRIVMVGHLLSSLYSDVATENTVDEPYIGWTYHQYPSSIHLSAMGKYTESSTGIDRILAGSEDGYIYLLDSGTTDDDLSIPWAIETGWNALGTALPLSKQLRVLNVIYGSNVTWGRDPDPGQTAGTVKFEIDADFLNAVDEITLTHGASSYCGYTYCGGTYAGLTGMFTENFPLSDDCVGRKFRFRISDDSEFDFSLMSISGMFRYAGLREGL